MKTSLSKLSSKYICPKIWSDIPKNLKSLSPFSFEKQYKNVLISANIPTDFHFICLSLFCNIVPCPYFLVDLLPLQLLTQSHCKQKSFLSFLCFIL